MIDRKIGFVGAGTMARSLVKGMIDAGVAREECIYAGDPSKESREAMRAFIGDNVGSDNKEVLKKCEIIILAVKPGVLPAVAAEAAPGIKEHHLLISKAPGITLNWLGEAMPASGIIRAMPNTPATVGEGATAFCSSDGCSETDIASAREIFSSVGLCIEVREEMMDAVTGLSGSGPAYAFMAIQALSDGGVKMGLSRVDATELAAQTLLGAARLVLSTKEHPEKLKDNVTTPGGTTIEGVHALERGAFRSALIGAVEAAARKSRESGREK